MKKIFSLAIIFFLIVVTAGCLQNNEKTNSSAGIALNENVEKNSLTELRQTYKIPLAVFEELPSAPSDFNRIVSLYHKGTFRQDMFFSEKYYLQPEFYPSFTQNGLNYWLNPSTTHRGVYGYGYFPIKRIIFIKPGEKAQVAFFLHSGYGVRTFQGMHLQPIFKKAGTEEFFDVRIKEPTFLLGPNFPKFNKSWAKAILLEVSAKEDAPKGSFAINIAVSSPPPEFNDRWKKELGNQYFNAAFASYGGSHFELTIVVE